MEEPKIHGQPVAVAEVWSCTQGIHGTWQYRSCLWLSKSVFLPFLPIFTGWENYLRGLKPQLSAKYIQIACDRRIKQACTALLTFSTLLIWKTQTAYESQYINSDNGNYYGNQRLRRIIYPENKTARNKHTSFMDIPRAWLRKIRGRKTTRNTTTRKR